MEEKNRFEKLEIDRDIESEEKKRAYLRLISTI
jgi:DnaJ-class molecular chaperone